MAIFDRKGAFCEKSWQRRLFTDQGPKQQKKIRLSERGREITPYIKSAPDNWPALTEQGWQSNGPEPIIRNRSNNVGRFSAETRKKRVYTEQFFRIVRHLHAIFTTEWSHLYSLQLAHYGIIITRWFIELR